jgi:hypothetical protein
VMFFHGFDPRFARVILFVHQPSGEVCSSGSSSQAALVGSWSNHLQQKC